MGSKSDETAGRQEGNESARKSRIGHYIISVFRFLAILGYARLKVEGSDTHTVDSSESRKLPNSV